VYNLNIDDKNFNKRLDEVYISYPFPDKFLNTCIDIGGNVGAFSVLFSNYCKKIISIEPYKPSYDYMVNIIKKFNITTIETVNKAISDVDGKMLEMSIGLGDDVDAKDITCVEKKDGMLSLGSIETISLESIIKEYESIDYLKVDCEGCEYDLLYGKDLSKINCLVVETHGGFIGGDSEKDLLEYLKSNFNYTFNDIEQMGKTYIFYNDDRPNYSELLMWQRWPHQRTPSFHKHYTYYKKIFL